MDHPRLCGEYHSGQPAPTASAGSSPPVRGIHLKNPYKIRIPVLEINHFRATWITMTFIQDPEFILLWEIDFEKQTLEQNTFFKNPKKIFFTYYHFFTYTYWRFII